MKLGETTNYIIECPECGSPSAYPIPVKNAVWPGLYSNIYPCTNCRKRLSISINVSAYAVKAKAPA